MVTTCVAFGPNDSYFFNSPTKWSRGGLPANVEKLFTGQNKVKDIFDMALAPDGSYSVTYQDASGLYILRHGLPPALEKWLTPSNNKCARDIRTLSIVLGANNSYFAHDKNGSAWGNLPSGLEAAIKARLDSKGRFKRGQGPLTQGMSVSLGPEGTYVYISEGGGGNWQLKGHFDELDQTLTSLKSLSGIGVQLSACRSGVYFALSSSGACDATVPTPQQPELNQFKVDWEQAIKNAKAQGAQVAARRQSINNTKSIARSLIKGLGVVNNILNAANGNGGGGGGQVFFSNDSSSFDASSNFWSPIQSAASDPIQ